LRFQYLHFPYLQHVLFRILTLSVLAFFSTCDFSAPNRSVRFTSLVALQFLTRCIFWVGQIPLSTSSPLPSHLIFIPLPLCSLPSLPFFRNRPLKYSSKVSQREAYGRCLGRSPSRKRIWCILALQSDIWRHQFY